MDKFMKTVPKLAAMRIGAINCTVHGALTYPLLDYGVCTYPLLVSGAYTYPLIRIWFLVCTSETINKM
jgi:hypothetical protein